MPRRVRVKRREKRTEDARFMVDLPVPPSANALTFNLPGKGRAKTAEYERWIAHAGLLVNAAVATALPKKPWGVNLRAKVNYGRDIDNLVKPVNDLLVTQGIIEDDRYVEYGEYQRVLPGECRFLKRDWLTVAVYSMLPIGLQQQEGRES